MDNSSLSTLQSSDQSMLQDPNRTLWELAELIKKLDKNFETFNQSILNMRVDIGLILRRIEIGDHPSFSNISELPKVPRRSVLRQRLRSQIGVLDPFPSSNPAPEAPLQIQHEKRDSNLQACRHFSAHQYALDWFYKSMVSSHLESSMQLIQQLPNQPYIYRHKCELIRDAKRKTEDLLKNKRITQKQYDELMNLRLETLRFEVQMEQVEKQKQKANQIKEN